MTEIFGWQITGLFPLNTIENGKGDMSKRQQPDQIANKNGRPQMGLQHSENIPQP